MATLAQIGDAVVSALNGHSFSQPVTAARSHLARVNLEDHTQLGCYVIASRLAAERVSFEGWQSDYAVQVMLYQKPVAAVDDTYLDGMVALAEEVLRFLADATILEMPCVEIEFNPEGGRALDLDELEARGAFVAVINATFREA